MIISYKTKLNLLGLVGGIILANVSIIVMQRYSEKQNQNLAQIENYLKKKHRKATIKHPQPQPAKTTISKAIHLEAIVFYSPSNWILWVNGQKLTKTKQANYKILQVNKEGAEFEIMLDNKPHIFWLNINQKYWFSQSD